MQYGGIKGRSNLHAFVDIRHKWRQALDDSE